MSTGFFLRKMAKIIKADEAALRGIEDILRASTRQIYSNKGKFKDTGFQAVDPNEPNRIEPRRS
jgi:hypothetical protein